MSRLKWEWFLWSVPFAAVAGTWLSALSFVPVPWPDDAAFYFAAHELFQWPPRWVMLPQAPFEPTYAEFNFNTMPLFPILIGAGRWIGIDGSHLLKLWSLCAWGATGALLSIVCYRAGLPALLASMCGLIVTMDPALRWTSVVVRPESMIALCGTALVLGLTLGFPARITAGRFWDPVAFLLAASAYLHFNAIHLLFPVLFAYATQPRRLFDIAAKTALYLTPWLLAVWMHLDLFIQQMTTQWNRLAVPNRWLNTQQLAISSMFQDWGNPEPWPAFLLQWGGSGIWVLLLTAIGLGFARPAVRHLQQIFRTRSNSVGATTPGAGLNLGIPAAWVVGAAWLWHTKPEPQFSSYIHFALWTFCGLALLECWNRSQFRWLAHLLGLMSALLLVFVYANISQAARLGSERTWNWDTYRSYVDCVERRLAGLEKELRGASPLQVWVPMFPDVTIELSRRHPGWSYTRHNDFGNRDALALRHGRQVDAVVLTEIRERGDANADREGPLDRIQDVRSAWLGEHGQILKADWRGYVLHELDAEPGWKPNRFFCQRGRWQAFLFMKNPPPGVPGR